MEPRIALGSGGQPVLAWAKLCDANRQLSELQGIGRAFWRHTYALGRHPLLRGPASEFLGVLDQRDPFVHFSPAKAAPKHLRLLARLETIPFERHQRDGLPREVLHQAPRLDSDRVD